MPAKITAVAMDAIKAFVIGARIMRGKWTDCQLSMSPIL
jgi:hypothetical protein